MATCIKLNHNSGQCMIGFARFQHDSAINNFPVSFIIAGGEKQHLKCNLTDQDTYTVTVTYRVRGQDHCGY